MHKQTVNEYYFCCWIVQDMTQSMVGNDDLRIKRAIHAIALYAKFKSEPVRQMIYRTRQLKLYRQYWL